MTSNYFGPSIPRSELYRLVTPDAMVDALLKCEDQNEAQERHNMELRKETVALRARVADLETKAAIADSVPWEEINELVACACDDPDYREDASRVSHWWIAHAPQDPPHAAQE